MTTPIRSGGRAGTGAHARVGARAWAIALTIAAGCAGEKPSNPEPGDDDDTTETTPECADDSECAAEIEICDAEQCVDGDRDDDPAAATPIAIGDENRLHGVIFPAGDVDTFVYDATEPQWVSVRTISQSLGDSSDLDTVVSVLDPAGALYAWMDDYPVYPFGVSGTLSTGESVQYDSVLYVFLSEAGAWTITVEDVTSHDPELEPAADAGYGYTVLVREAAGTVGDNDSAANPSLAADVSSEASVVAFGVVIDEPGDTDYAEVTFPFDDHLLEVWGQPNAPGSTAAPLVRIVDGADVVAEKRDLGVDGWLSWFRAHSGTFLLEATDANGDGGPAAWFTLYLRTYAPGDAHPFFGTNLYTPEAEPNDDPLGALVLARDALDAFRFDAAIDAPGDQDWFRIDARTGDLLTVRCWTELFGSLAELEVSLWADDAEFAHGDAPDADDYYVVQEEPPRDGPIDVRVHDRGGAAGPAGWYRCAVYAQP